MLLDLSGDFLSDSFRSASMQDYIGPRRSQLQSDCLANAAGGAGHQSALACQFTPGRLTDLLEPAQPIAQNLDGRAKDGMDKIRSDFREWIKDE
jgi:hypothetical protein